MRSWRAAGNTPRRLTTPTTRTLGRASCTAKMLMLPCEDAAMKMTTWIPWAISKIQADIGLLRAKLTTEQMQSVRDFKLADIS